MIFNWKYILTTIRTNSCYKYFLTIQLMAGLTLFIYVLTDPKNNIQQAWVDILEWLLLVCILLDVIFRMLTQRKKFFNSKWNIIDLVVVLIITILMIILIYIIDLEEKESDSLEGTYVFTICLLVIRYIMLLLRFVFVIKEARSMSQTDKDDISFELEKNSIEKTKESFDEQDQDKIRSNTIKQNIDF